MAVETWVTQYRNDQVWAYLQEIVTSISEYEIVDPTHRDQASEVRRVAAAALALSSADPHFVSPSRMSDFRTHTEHVRNYISQWLSTGSESYISTAYENLVQLQDTLFGWTSGKSDSLRSAAKVLQNTTEELQSAQDTFSKTVSRQQKTLDALFEQKKQDSENFLEEARTSLAESADQIQQQVAATSERLVTLTNQLASIERRNTQLVESLQKQFNNAEESRSSSHEELLRNHRSSLTSALSETKTNLDSYATNQTQELNKHRDRVVELKEEIEQIVGAMGVLATAEWYKNNADAQQKSANIWRLVAIGGFILAFVVVAYSVFFVDHAEETWKSTIIKTTASATLAAGAVYASRESSKHRTQEFADRKTELTLRALDPFIANLDEKPRRRLKADATRKVFDLGLEEDEEIEEDEESQLQ
jgi:flagellar basal body-associated protein FliL